MRFFNKLMCIERDIASTNKSSNNLPQKTRWCTPMFATQILLLATLQYPLNGHCDSAYGWFKKTFESKGKNMQEVATKVTTLNEDNMIWGLDFSPDGKHLAVTSPTSREVHVWDWQNGRQLKSLKKEGADDPTTIQPIRYSPDGRLFALCGGVIARIWDTTTWELIHTIDGANGLTGAGGGCRAVEFTPDSQSLALVQLRLPDQFGNNLAVYDTSTWQSVWGVRTELPVIRTDSEWKHALEEWLPFSPDSIAINPNGRLAALGGVAYGSVSSDQIISHRIIREQPQILIVDMEQHKVTQKIQAFPASQTIQMVGTIDRLAWSPDGAYIAAGVSATNSEGADAIRIFNVQSGGQVAHEPAPIGTHIRGLRYTPDGKYLLEAGIGHSLKIWDGQHQKLLQEINESGEVSSIAVSRDSHYFAFGMINDGDTRVQIWKFN